MSSEIYPEDLYRMKSTPKISELSERSCLVHSLTTSPHSFEKVIRRSFFCEPFYQLNKVNRYVQHYFVCKTIFVLLSQCFRKNRDSHCKIKPSIFLSLVRIKACPIPLSLRVDLPRQCSHLQPPTIPHPRRMRQTVFQCYYWPPKNYPPSTALSYLQEAWLTQHLHNHLEGMKCFFYFNKPGPKLTLNSLLESGKGSDLTITCQGETFKVHKAIVCLRSELFTAACWDVSKVRTKKTARNRPLKQGN